MMQIAVFVDAGYLFAAGSVAIEGRTVARSELALDVDATIVALRAAAQTCAVGARLLRIYWYDGSIGGGRPTSAQSLIANKDDVKLRLGHVNSKGEQKEVDSFIVTDLIELARLKSITDAVVLAGDGDLRVGVAIAQSHGVRIHLLGIDPAERNQSLQLRQEADTKTVWSIETVTTFLSRRIALTEESAKAAGGIALPARPSRNGGNLIQETVSAFVAKLTASDLTNVSTYWEAANRGVPPDLDSLMLRECAGNLGHPLDADEKRLMRKTFSAEVKSALSTRR